MSSQGLRNESKGCRSGSRQGALSFLHQTFVYSSWLGSSGLQRRATRAPWLSPAKPFLLSPFPQSHTISRRAVKMFLVGTPRDASPPNPQSASNHLHMEEALSAQLCSLIILPNPSGEPQSQHTVPRRTLSLQGPVGCTNTPLAFASL